MSDYERNKGKLIPKNIDISEFNDEGIESLIEDGYQVINGTVYTVEWETERFTGWVEFADVKENPDGSINFHTLHYNGSASWTEIIEEALTNDQ